jgi:CRP-like cAMP-binding protein
MSVAGRRPGSAGADGARSWNFLTNHSHVLLALYRDPDLRQRDIAGMVGITEGAVQRILHDLEGGGYIARSKVGRRNHYTVNPDLPLRHPLEAHHKVADLLTSLDT